MPTASPLRASTAACSPTITSSIGDGVVCCRHWRHWSVYIKTGGAGRNVIEAAAPAALDLADKARVLVFSFGAVTSGIPHNWAATADNPGVNLLTRLSDTEALRAADYILGVRRPGDLAGFASLGIELGLRNPRRTTALRAHPHRQGECVYHLWSFIASREGHRGLPQRLILYGCGDFLNDYEGIRGYEDFRSDLALMYFADIEPATGNLAALDRASSDQEVSAWPPFEAGHRVAPTHAPAGMSAVRHRDRARSGRAAGLFLSN